MNTPGVPIVTLRLSDPEPPVGTALHVGNNDPSSGDRATFLRLESGWVYAYGGSPLRPCTYDLVRWWLPARVTAGPLISAPQAWAALVDEEEAA